jgi:hypothetical protein
MDKLKEFSKRLKYLFEPSDSYRVGYDNGYIKGVKDGRDFGKRIAYNQVLRKEVPSILSKYSQLQVKIINKPKTEVQKQLREFTTKEIERLSMELQNR